MKAKNPMGELMLSANSFFNKIQLDVSDIFHVFLDLHELFDENSLGLFLHLHSLVGDDDPD